MTNTYIGAVVVLTMPLLVGLTAGWYIRKRKALRDGLRLCHYYESLLKASIVEQHVYMDRPANIYVAVCSQFAYVGQTMQKVEQRIQQHARGTSGFDRVYGRNPDQWQWFVLETVPCTYRYAAERSWIQHYKNLNYQLMNGNNGTDDGLEWEVLDANTSNR